MNLLNAIVTGYYSLPSQHLAGENPSAYNNQLAIAPPGAGVCQHCGRPIVHHVLIQVDSKPGHIGTTCAEKVGVEQGATQFTYAVRLKLTTEQVKAKQAKIDAEWEAEQNLTAERDAEKQVIKAYNLKLLKRFFGFTKEQLNHYTKNSTGFMHDCLLDAANGSVIGGWYPRRLDIFCQIRAKDFGRGNSKAYNAEYEKLWDLIQLEIDKADKEYEAA